jgi:carbonic anhydrase
MRDLTFLLAKNKAWSEEIRRQDPDFFLNLSKIQTPQFLWIGCSDSRVPANQIVGLPPGELFVHRNVANLVVHSDLNCLSVIQFAVDLLKVRHIIVCGHYGCSGVRASFYRDRLGLSDNWLRHVQDVRQKHNRILERLPEDGLRLSRLCELNVIEQAVNVGQTTVVREAWERGQELSVHGCIYGLEDGLLRDLKMTVTGPGEISRAFQNAIELSAVWSERIKVPSSSADAATDPSRKG